jgi:hypothetical protein
MAKKRILRDLKILELSAVDTPAQEGATMVIMKRNFTDQERQHAAASGAAMPSGAYPIQDRGDLVNAIHAWGRANPSERGAVARHIKSRASALGLTDLLPTEGELASAMHNTGKAAMSKPDAKGADTTKPKNPVSGDTHIQDSPDEDNEYDGAELRAPSEGDAADNADPSDDDSGGADSADTDEADPTKKPGKGKSKAWYAKFNEEADMKELQKALAEIAILKAQVGMSDSEKAHFATLDDEQATSFITMDKAGRKEHMEGDPVVYTDKRGAIYHRSEQRSADLAKALDAEIEKTAKAENEAAEVELTKRAETTLAHLKGATEVKVAMLKAVEGIKDETTRTAALEILKASDAGVAAATKELGSSAGLDSAAGEVNDQIEGLAKQYAANHKVSHASAYAAVIESAEGRKLYAESVKRMPQPAVMAE